ncbi:RES family NAD+ phosphorylase [Brucella pituitosa]|uniref:RES family NAD+ phosphorylase n=1 Tax=Brucella pituitosa TaxID=571256 RepID=UPI002093B09F|nr:RES family NAD+ phosphorylase [Brucella pituitosa]
MLHPDILQQLAVQVDVSNYVRILPRIYAASPLGMGFGLTRFSSPKNKFQLLYLAQNPMTAVAETIVRDRFEKESGPLPYARRA